jgi:hypothetical protein
MVRALFMAGRPAEAIAVLERNARTHWVHDLWLAACHAAMGSLSTAHEAGQRVMTVRPGFTIATYLDGGYKWKKPEDRARLCNALTQVALPND